MTILDYILLGGFAAALFYAGCRLFVGWLRTPSHEIQSETSDIPNRFTVDPSARECALEKEAAADMRGQLH